MQMSNLDNDDAQSEMELDKNNEVVIFPQVPIEGAVVKKFVEFDGW